MVVKINLLGDSESLSNISYFVSNNIKRKDQELPKGTSESPKWKIKIKSYLEEFKIRLIYILYV